MNNLNIESIQNRIKENSTINAKTGCWEWKLYCNKNNHYGLAWVGTQDGRKVWSTAHRLSYIVFNGPIPEGMEVAHKCHNRKCCNPDHLIATDHQTNVQMSVDAGRTRKGTDKPNAKLNEAIVRTLREGTIFDHLSHEQVARIFGIAVRTLRDALYGRTWTHVTV